MDDNGRHRSPSTAILRRSRRTFLSRGLDQARTRAGDLRSVPLSGTRHVGHPRTTYRTGPFHRLARDDRGSVSAELVIATPVLLLMLLVIVQFALWSHATHIAQAAASQGLAAARAQDGTPASGTASARQLLDQLAAGPLRGAVVSADRGTASASVRISGTATPVVPWLSLPVHAEAAGPVERFVPDPTGG